MGRMEDLRFFFCARAFVYSGPERREEVTGKEWKEDEVEEEE